MEIIQDIHILPEVHRISKELAPQRRKWPYGSKRFRCFWWPFSIDDSSSANSRRFWTMCSLNDHLLWRNNYTRLAPDRILSGKQFDRGSVVILEKQLKNASRFPPPYPEVSQNPFRHSHCCSHPTVWVRNSQTHTNRMAIVVGVEVCNSFVCTNPIAVSISSRKLLESASIRLDQSDQDWGFRPRCT